MSVSIHRIGKLVTVQRVVILVTIQWVVMYGSGNSLVGWYVRKSSVGWYVRKSSVATYVGNSSEMFSCPEAVMLEYRHHHVQCEPFTTTKKSSDFEQTGNGHWLKSA